MAFRPKDTKERILHRLKIARGHLAARAATFSTATENLSDVKPTEIVALTDGASFDLTASMVKGSINGYDVKLLAYNGQVPGPTIRVKKGSTITIHFKNDTDVDSIRSDDPPFLRLLVTHITVKSTNFSYDVV